MDIKRVKKSSLTKVCLLAKPVLKPDIQLWQTVYCILWHSDLLHIPAVYTFRIHNWEPDKKTELLKLHSGLWCRLCAPYGYVPLSHLGNIVLTNEIVTFHNGGISSTKCATLIISVFFLLQKIMKNVLLSISFQIILLLFIYSMCSRKEATFTSQNDL